MQLCIRRIASASSGARETTCTLGESFTGWPSTVSVASIRRIGLASRRSMHSCVNTPWVIVARTSVAPRHVPASGGTGKLKILCQSRDLCQGAVAGPRLEPDRFSLDNPVRATAFLSTERY